MSTGKVTPADIEANIRSEFYFTASEGVNHCNSDDPELDLLTYCVLVPMRGDPITAYSLAADPADLNPAIERYIARQKAFNKLGELMAYAAKAAIHDQPTSQSKGITA